MARENRYEPWVRSMKHENDKLKADLAIHKKALEIAVGKIVSQIPDDFYYDAIGAGIFEECLQQAREQEEPTP